MNNKSFLIVEDILTVATGIQERIRNCFDVPAENIFCCYFPDEALDFLDENCPDIIIIDLAMDCAGLPKAERELSFHSRLTGWVILFNHIINGEFKEKLQNTHCYIFSGYAKIFASELKLDSDDNGVNIDAINKRLAEYRNNIYFVPKVGADGGANELIQAIKSHL